MQLIENIDLIRSPFKNAVITIGNFDGVHKGHQYLFSQVMDKAEQINGTSVIMTFEPHPLRALGISGPPLITRRDQKLELICACGPDVILCLPFNKEFAAVSPLEFIDILVNKIGIKAIITGPDYSFGKDRKGNTDLLIKEGEKNGFETIISTWTHTDDLVNERISSTGIREIVMAGKVDQACKYLGAPYQIRGKVIKGRQRGGSLIGFPTANIKLHDELCPKVGVYAVTVESIQGNFYGVANIGFAPTFDDHQLTIEVHIMDFSHDIYDSRIRFNFIKRIRDEKKFNNINELSEQIKKDIETAREVIKNYEHSQNIKLS